MELDELLGFNEVLLFSLRDVADMGEDKLSVLFRVAAFAEDECFLSKNIPADPWGGREAIRVAAGWQLSSTPARL